MAPDYLPLLNDKDVVVGKFNTKAFKKEADKELGQLRSPSFDLLEDSEQIRRMEQLELSNPPVSYELSFDGLEKQPNGMYLYEDFMRHLQISIEAYNATALGKNPWD